MSNDEFCIKIESDDEDIALFNILDGWELTHLYDIFVEQKINANILKNMNQSHIDKFFQNLTIGDQVHFERSLQILKKEVPEVPEEFSTLSELSTHVFNKSVKTYNLKTILKNSNGQMIKKYYEKHGMFHEEQRNILINIVARYIEADGCNLSLRESVKIEHDIIKMFPTEKLEFYTDGKRGRLYNKVSNLKRNIKPLTIPEEFYVNPISTKIEMSNDEFSTEMESEDEDENTELFNILLGWQLTHLYDIFVEQKINEKILKYMNQKHIDKLFRNLTLGDQILFEQCLQIWKNEVPEAAEECTTLSELSTNSFHKDTQKYDLETILKNPNGQMLTKYYENHGMFHEEQRNILINIIARYIEADGCVLSLMESAKIERDIIRMFPTEELEYYRVGKRGRIYNKVANLKRNIKQLLTKPKELSVDPVSITLEDDVEFVLGELRSGSITPEEFTEYWKRCSQYRFHQISELKSTQDILKKWPEYKKPSGFKYIDIDFSLKFGSSSSLLINWEENVTKLETLFNRKVNPATLKVLDKMYEYSEDSRDMIILWAIHSLFPPTTKSVKDSSGAKLKKRFAVSDSQDSFLIIGENSDDIERKIQILRQHQKTIHPCLLVTGSLSNVKEIHVYLDNIRFPLLGTVRAADILFKIFILFNLEYPEESESFYQFVQTFFYKIPTNKKNVKVSTIINEINSL